MACASSGDSSPLQRQNKQIVLERHIAAILKRMEGYVYRMKMIVLRYHLVNYKEHLTICNAMYDLHLGENLREANIFQVSLITPD